MVGIHYTYVMFPCYFGDPRVCPDAALHVDIVSLFDGGNLQFAAQLQVDNGNILGLMFHVNENSKKKIEAVEEKKKPKMGVGG